MQLQAEETAAWTGLQQNQLGWDEKRGTAAAQLARLTKITSYT